MTLALETIENGLWQALSQDKRPLAMLLGAGCPASVPAANGDCLIPTIAGLTKTVGGPIQATEWAEQYDTLRAMLLADKAHEPNVEELLTRLRSLREIAGKETVRGLTASDINDLEKALTPANR